PVGRAPAVRGRGLRGAGGRVAHGAGANRGGATREGAWLEGARVFWGRPQTASPAQPGQPPDLQTGSSSGAIVENANFAGVRLLDPQTHFYLASWSGSRSRTTLPGGAKGITNQMERR
ncbi:MAG: hypothetical protein ACK550_03085, partial [Synechococcaceae cyanobacterium]